MKVKNIDTAIDIPDEYESWLQYWTALSKRKALVCSAKTCINTEPEGALVRKSDAPDDSIYLVPLCTTHKSMQGTIELIAGTRLVLISKAYC